jgi:23S rRNA (guanosine2251-2'-O)-methyltransferase
VHQGVIAQVKKVPAKTVSLEELCERDQLLLLILDEVQDPHNIGACLRTADAVAADAVIVSKNRSPGLTAAVRKVSSGAADSVPFVQVSNLARTLQTLREHDVRVLGAAGEADCDLYDCQVSPKTALVMGSEGKGMRRLTRENCDQLISLPMLGSVESLNVSVATGVCLYQLRHKQNAL